MIVRKENIICRWIVPIILVAIGVSYALLTWFYTYTGDDLEYRHSWEVYYKDIMGYPLFAFRHWFHLNGRIADKINPFTLSMMPQWLYAIVNGVVVALMYFAVVKSAKSRSLTGCVVCVSTVALTLTWWDYMVVYVCNLNYLWSAAFGLLAIRMVLSETKIESRLKLWSGGLFAIMAGGMHEASGMPLACGVIAWLYMTKGYRSLMREQKILLKCFFVGALFSISSPGSYERLIDRTCIVDGEEVSALVVVIGSAYITLLMVAWIAVGMMIRSMRENILRLIRTPWVIFVVASVVSLVFCSISGIIGRTGWFSQIFAVIAIFYYYNETGLRISRKVAVAISTVLIVVLAVHFAVLLRQQYVMGCELKTAIAEYRESTDGVVYMDYTRDSQQHPLALRKARGVPDPHEGYFINSITNFYGSEEHPFVVVPTAVKQLSASDVKGVVNLGNGFCISDSNVGIDESDYVVVPFRKDGATMFLLSPRELDPDNPDYYRRFCR